VQLDLMMIRGGIGMGTGFDSFDVSDGVRLLEKVDNMRCKAA
jgi:hypothetical protein